MEVRYFFTAGNTGGGEKTKYYWSLEIGTRFGTDITTQKKITAVKEVGITARCFRPDS
jgi:hypothetical protein